MATRDLSRTIVEGGRGGSCRSEEHEGLVSERARVRDLLRKVCVDPSLAGEVEMPRPGELDGWIDLDFNDRLNPLRRWIAAQVGRRWDDVRGELCRRYDRRTTKGRHLVDHVDRTIGQYRGWTWVPPEYVIDEQGILRRAR